MSGSVRIRLGNAWTPAGWIFDNVLDDVAREVAQHDARLGQTIRDATEGFQHLDLSSWTAHQLTGFVEAAIVGREQRRRSGAGAFSKPEFFPALMAEYDQLLEQLRLDPRLASSTSPGGPRGPVAPPQ